MSYLKAMGNRIRIRISILQEQQEQRLSKKRQRVAIMVESNSNRWACKYQARMVQNQEFPLDNRNLVLKIHWNLRKYKSTNGY